jgi:CheY-like chemotaxis protein/anti-sigma regulatory factor (Ser/Thr protein kinase)
VPAPEETRVLIVDDNKLDRELLRVHLEQDGYDIEQKVSGQDAWDTLVADPAKFDVVLLDRSMPGMDGLQLMARMKEHPRLRGLPVILQTALTSREHILEGIRAGAYYYLTKPWDRDELLTVVETAAHDHAERKLLQEGVRRGLKVLRQLREAVFFIRTVDDARDLGAVLANCCPDPMNSVIGITELLVNAVEHGNLGITYEEKSSLNADGTWDEEVKRRLALPEHAGKFVEVRFERDENEIRFVIRDQGRGFDFQRFLDVDPLRAFDNHGRGIAMARRLSFDSVEYRGAGNEVVGKVRLAKAS